MNQVTEISTQYAPSTIEEAQALVTAHPRILPHGAQTKAPLLHSRNGAQFTRLDIKHLAGITEYDPGEYTFTAYAGTRLADIAATLAQHGQYMPFDPPLVKAGATLGGTVAAGLSGSGRNRYGGVRDFILGVQIIDGQGRLIRGGGKVVKNAAGFDLPKLMVGSMGRLGILVSASFKVFPAPPVTATLVATLPNLASAITAMTKLTGGPYDLEALDLLPQNDGTTTLLARIGGPADVLPLRLDRLRTLVGIGDDVRDDTQLWDEAREFTWATSTNLLVKVATTVQSLPALDQSLSAAGATRRYAVSGNLAWVNWPTTTEACHNTLAQLGLSGLIIRGETDHALIGASIHSSFLTRIRAALDPDQRFADFTE